MPATRNTTSIDSLRARLKLSTEQLTRAHLDNQPANIIQQMQTESEQLIAWIALIQRSEQYLSPEKDNSNITTQTTITVFENIEGILDNFELQVNSVGLDINHYWEHLMPLCMNTDQQSWFNVTLRGRTLQWAEVRTIVEEKYATEDVAQQIL
ncbi:hypothetical protein BDF20DRAFT_915131 [Mycotypha africana]|uniref:uncharacterized protein n=1 Tax=Mycotypha africana TaxID=64632 RepID=UPI002300D338|nr:uncharacterized protein BDF20DRAFT_915131 [Mycotypha africana]KAI8973723.1 hypothetical protein BDF20DRAFT_915131 [Mycotypha africana]